MTTQRESGYMNALEEAIMTGWDCMKSGLSSVDAVEMAVENLENNPLFNAGKGSVFTNKGNHEMDASIMDGKTL
jgi:beta-aspartyl-peptidase (threonine type)